MPTLPGTSRPGAVPVLGAPEDGLVTPVPFEDLPEPLRGELAARVERLGYLGGFFGVAAHQPDPLLHFNRFTESLKDGLPGRLSEVVALAAAAAAGNQYELVQHIRLARKLGCPDTWIRAAAYGPDAPADGLADGPAEDPADGPGNGRVLYPALDPDEQAVRALAVAAMGGHGAQAELSAVVARLGQATAVGVLLLLGRYVAHAMVARVLGLGPPVSLDPPLAPTRNASPRRTP
jgi:alkylhydroperoxidase family enzyme